MEEEKKTSPLDEEPRPRRTARQWESAVEQSIRDAIERGEFENLPGAGKPLDLARDPHTPAEWEMAFKLLKDSGFAPAWIEEDKEIRAARANLYAPFENYLARRAAGDPPRPDFVGRLVDDFRTRASELNRRIDLFNLRAPSPRVHHTRIRVEAEIAKFKQATAHN